MNVFPISHYTTRCRFALWLLIVGSLICPVSVFAGSVDISSTVGKVKYVLKLTLSEFSILIASEVDGLVKYGGIVDFQLKMAKEGDDVVWIVTIDNPRIMELLGIFVGEKTVKLVQGLDPDNIGMDEKTAFAAIRTLSQKIEFAQKSPIYDEVQMTGIVIEQGANVAIQTREGVLTMTGGKSYDFRSLLGKSIIAKGFVKVPGQFEVTHYLEKKQNTLELFVMSLCPYAQKAEAKLLNFLSSTNVSVRPKMEIRYLFYKQTKDGKDEFYSLHGEPEIEENLVQMAIRDLYPSNFEQYILLRTQSPSPWPSLAEQIGIAKADVEAITSIIKTNRDEMIMNEYFYATLQYGITDGSPTYVWESQKVSDLRTVELFKNLDSAQDACKQ